MPSIFTLEGPTLTAAPTFVRRNEPGLLGAGLGALSSGSAHFWLGALLGGASAWWAHGKFGHKFRKKAGGEVAGLRGSRRRRRRSRR